jgi:hypothetical protein
MGDNIPKVLDLDENPINESNTTLEFENSRTKSHPLLKIWPLNCQTLNWMKDAMKTTS